jgi:hypothetical protein
MDVQPRIVPRSKIANAGSRSTRACQKDPTARGVSRDVTTHQEAGSIDRGRGMNAAGKKDAMPPTREARARAARTAGWRFLV